ncbi:MAG TPA: dihydrodipicolinate reductase C-terminal domain-containing protein [Pyrinomonadaceae bacterium]|nr:dihydrodipicolinate reductase C-terminal domain-containing protein [Pyrinomonadaceae bacterium]
MKIALIGYGAMGKLIRTLAEEKGHEIAVVLDESDAGLSGSDLSLKLAGCDAAIDFSVAEAVRRNVEVCVLAGVPLVEGTTGWNADRPEIELHVRENSGSVVFGANFSIGVNLFYRIADFASELFAKFPQYEAFIEEQHHSRKKDAPSGTALKIKEIVTKHIDSNLTVSATRAGNIPGTHRVGFDGPADQVLLEHTARSREGFAAGAILAAEWIVGKTGFYEFTDVMDEILHSKNT